MATGTLSEPPTAVADERSVLSPNIKTLAELDFLPRWPWEGENAKEGPKLKLGHQQKLKLSHSNSVASQKCKIEFDGGNNESKFPILKPYDGRASTERERDFEPGKLQRTGTDRTLVGEFSPEDSPSKKPHSDYPAEKGQPEVTQAVNKMTKLWSPTSYNLRDEGVSESRLGATLFTLEDPSKGVEESERSHTSRFHGHVETSFKTIVQESPGNAQGPPSLRAIFSPSQHKGPKNLPEPPQSATASPSLKNPSRRELQDASEFGDETHPTTTADRNSSNRSSSEEHLDPTGRRESPNRSLRRTGPRASDHGKGKISSFRGHAPGSAPQSPVSPCSSSRRTSKSSYTISELSFDLTGKIDAPGVSTVPCREGTLKNLRRQLHRPWMKLMNRKKKPQFAETEYEGESRESISHGQSSGHRSSEFGTSPSQGNRTKSKRGRKGRLFPRVHKSVMFRMMLTKLEQLVTKLQERKRRQAEKKREEEMRFGIKESRQSRWRKASSLTQTIVEEVAIRTGIVKDMTKRILKRRRARRDQKMMERLWPMLLEKIMERERSEQRRTWDSRAWKNLPTDPEGSSN
ncbi:hypothetical protein BJ508DRAFT_378859 [Ascobolus immersus RN42]|uniref:Uncharacterized protein n=1 Tax=Ascobolus immersus RN42 TaxID=1160509 RepID=A0A3N4HUD8_ASCIM|nr:hypothetical protein BJ508DRAFT_378859 [Ascobolus immersus RN42]